MPWTFFLWTLKLPLVDNCLPQKSQGYFSPLWTPLTCCLRVPFSTNLLPHSRHTKGFSPVWMWIFLCLFKRNNVGHLEPHVSHLCSRAWESSSSRASAASFTIVGIWEFSSWKKINFVNGYIMNIKDGKLSMNIISLHIKIWFWFNYLFKKGCSTWIAKACPLFTVCGRLWICNF